MVNKVKFYIEKNFILEKGLEEKYKVIFYYKDNYKIIYCCIFFVSDHGLGIQSICYTFQVINLKKYC